MWEKFPVERSSNSVRFRQFLLMRKKMLDISFKLAYFSDRRFTCGVTKDRTSSPHQGGENEIQSHDEEIARRAHNNCVGRVYKLCDIVCERHFLYEEKWSERLAWRPTAQEWSFGSSRRAPPKEWGICASWWTPTVGSSFGSAKGT
jgi:hypothetical protein